MSDINKPSLESFLNGDLEKIKNESSQVANSITQAILLSFDLSIEKMYEVKQAGKKLEQDLNMCFENFIKKCI